MNRSVWLLIAAFLVATAGCRFEEAGAMIQAAPATTPETAGSPSDQGAEKGCPHCDTTESASLSRPVEVVEAVNRPLIPDVVLTDQHGRTHRLYTDLLKGKLVLMNAIYTTCQGTCPMQTSIFAGVQRRLRDRVGDDVHMISISLDPRTDTPERLLEFARTYKAEDTGWYFLTGEPEDVFRALKAMDLYSARPEEHTPIAAVGNEPTGVWMKVINLTNPVELVQRLEYVSQLGLQDVVAD